MSAPGVDSPAAPERTTDERVDVLQLVVFRIGGEEYALDILSIKEIVNPLRITPVPRAPTFVEGVVELRGTILPIVDLRKRFEVEAAPLSRRSKYIIVGIHGRIVGLVVDAVLETMRLPQQELKAPPALIEGALAADYFQGVCYLKGRILFVLNLDRILTSQERLKIGGLDAGSADDGEAPP